MTQKYSFRILGYLIVMMGACSSGALKIYPPFQHYNGTTEFTSFICSNDDDSYVNPDDVEWLNPNFTMLTSTLNNRICVYGDFVTFNPPLFSDAGSYWCRNKTNRSDMAEGKLIIYGSPELIVEQNEEVTFSIGEEVILNCTVSAPPDPVYSWSFPDSCSSCPNTSNDSVLIFTAEDITDSGEYTCVTENQYGSLLVTFNVTVIRTPVLVSKQNQTVTVNVTEEVILNCTVSASPDPVYSWSFPDSCSSCPNTSNDSVLIFTAEDVTDSGEYTCVAENQYGDLSVTFNVTVITPPTFVFSNNSVLFEERITLLGSDVFINCSVNYGTKYNITSWSFDYEPLLINRTSKYSQNTSGLTVYNVTELDEGNYTCYVDQLLAIIVIHIEWSPLLLSEHNQTVTVSVGEEVILNCTVSASPDPVYSWSFPDSCSSCPNTSNDSVLIFTAEDITDSGEYTCVAENRYGKVTQQFKLYVNYHKAKNDITNTTRDGCDNDNYVSSQIFGIVVGLLCVVIASLLCVIVIIFIRKSKCYKSRNGEDPRDHLEMMSTKLYDRSTSPKPLKFKNEEEISDTSDLRSPTNQTKNESCGGSSIEKSTKDH